MGSVLRGRAHEDRPALRREGDQLGGSRPRPEGREPLPARGGARQARSTRSTSPRCSTPASIAARTCRSSRWSSSRARTSTSSSSGVGPLAPGPRAAHRRRSRASGSRRRTRRASSTATSSPRNLFLARRDAGEILVKLLDFGIAKVKMDRANETESADLTRTGNLIGSPLYMSPEQARGPEGRSTTAPTSGRSAPCSTSC